MIDKSNIKTTNWLTRSISPEKLAKEKAKAIKSANKELARREKKIQKEKRRILKRFAKAGFTYEEVMGIIVTYLSTQQPFDMSDEEYKRIVDKFNDVPEVYSIGDVS